MNVRFTLIGDGPFDAVLVPILAKLVRGDCRVVEIESQFADPSVLPRAREGLSSRIAATLSLYPCDLLFIHRDAEKETLEFRRSEIQNSLIDLPDAGICVPVVPVRMTEAWLLFDEAAIRRAAGNPSGSIKLNLPRIQDVEFLPNPKGCLHEALVLASERRGRARVKFNSAIAAQRVIELIDDISPLTQLPAFRQLSTDTAAALERVARLKAAPPTHPTQRRAL